MKKQLNHACSENFSLVDIMSAFMWMPYKDFAKSIINDDNRDII